MPLVLRATEVAPLLDMPRAIALTEDVLSEQARGRVAVHAPYHLPVENGALRVVSGVLLDSHRMGLRCGPTMPVPNGARGNHAALLYDTSGELLAIIGYPFGTLRTGATIAASVKHLSRPDAGRVGLIGTGRNALGLLEGVRLVRDITGVRAFSRDPERREKFCAEASRLTGVPVEPVAEAKDAVAGMDIVLTASNQRVPLFPAAWLEAGTHVSSMGPIGELDADVFLKANRVVVTNKEQEKNYFIPTPPFPLVDLVAAGRMTWDEIAELGDVIGDHAVGRQSADDITVFHESQGGFGDIAFAAWAYDEACRRGLGQRVSL